MKRYLGTIDYDGRKHVEVVDYAGDMPRQLNATPQPLSERLDLLRYVARHSNEFFTWGKLTAATYQLALAMIADATKDRAIALTWHQVYARDVLAWLDESAPWWISQGQIKEWVRQQVNSSFLEKEWAKMPVPAQAC